MHPDPLYRSEDRALMETLIDQIGFGMIFAPTVNGPRLAHTPLLSTGDGAVQFHLSRGNALAGHLEGQVALALVNGPEAYISPRWYSDPDTVPTWDYIALELEGPVRRMGEEGLDAMLRGLIDRHEKRLGGERWSPQQVRPERWRRLMGQVIGFEMEIAAWRPTLKLSQEKAPDERAAIAHGLDQSGARALAHLIGTRA